jgi:hypothetical protein
LGSRVADVMPGTSAPVVSFRTARRADVGRKAIMSDLKHPTPESDDSRYLRVTTRVFTFRRGWHGRCKTLGSKAMGC